jgi:uncharacterized membrane protein YfcA
VEAPGWCSSCPNAGSCRSCWWSWWESGSSPGAARRWVWTARIRYRGAGLYLRLALIGLVIGCYDGAIGPGTGTFFVIALVGLVGYGFLEASAMAKLANLTTNAAALVVFWIHGVIWWRVGLMMAVANVVGGWVGARMAVRHGNQFVRRVFLVTVAGLSVKLGWDTVTSFLP